MTRLDGTRDNTFLAGPLTEENVGAAIDAYLADPSITAFAFEDGARIDLTDGAPRQAWACVADADAMSVARLKRGVVRTAIMLARLDRD
ncbi:hypothetical protein ASF49_07910 [Methylobacterium sp. Leaf104]|uniref:hypothetical protein n=1 Tax=Methylobacterium TaxID=407 RepID=UPI0006FD26B8|nr:MULTISPECIES: hypothetical protein [Methylobacterium]KQP33784.1 hypothetical protein ASF49_07910 [Methylobacterium sp. Leaf104]MCI9879651.1 hypothetical protein [Methylobacterium goesingense]